MRILLASFLFFGAAVHSSERCRSSEYLKFSWSWCSDHQGGAIKKVCFGSMTVGLDSVSRAIQIESLNPDGTSNFECLAGSRTGTDGSSDSCPWTVEREFSSTTNATQRTRVTECHDEGFTVWIQGKSLAGDEFESHP